MHQTKQLKYLPLGSLGGTPFPSFLVSGESPTISYVNPDGMCRADLMVDDLSGSGWHPCIVFENTFEIGIHHKRHIGFFRYVFVVE